MLTGLMMDDQLTLTHFLRRARQLFPRSTVVSRLDDGSLHRYTYADLCQRTARLAQALERLGVRPGDRVATLAWNHYRHLECYLAIPCMGAVLHTLNLRLHPDDIAYIANHAQDKVVIVDESLLPLLQRFRGQLRTVEHFIVMGNASAEDVSYEDLLEAEAGGDFAWPRLEEAAAAALCYTSGTTGNPKGVLFSHRSTVLHSLAVCNADAVGLRGRDRAMPVVPMFHANAWGLPYAAVAQGAGLVMPGPHLHPESLLKLMEQERVTVAAGVPTIWLGLLAEMDAHPHRWNLKGLRSVVGGMAAPASMIDGFASRHGIEVLHAWGMTETSPLGSISRCKPHVPDLEWPDELAVRTTQGYVVPLVEQRHVDEENRALPWDGQSMGELEVRGPWVAASYFGGEGADRFTADGWFKTGDVVTIDQEGYIRITDRAKDVIKSGGEWISSVALENHLMGCPAVLEAAVFAVRHPKWDERPMAALVLKQGQTCSVEELKESLASAFPKWWLPEDYLFLDQLPKTSTGKLHKSVLRDRYWECLSSREP